MSINLRTNNYSGQWEWEVGDGCDSQSLWCIACEDASKMDKIKKCLTWFWSPSSACSWFWEFLIVILASSDWVSSFVVTYWSISGFTTLQFYLLHLEGFQKIKVFVFFFLLWSFRMKDCLGSEESGDAIQLLTKNFSELFVASSLASLPIGGLLWFSFSINDLL